MAATDRRKWLTTSLGGLVGGTLWMAAADRCPATDAIPIGQVAIRNTPPFENVISASQVVQLKRAEGRAAVITAMAVHEPSGLLCVATDDDHLRLVRMSNLLPVEAVDAHRDRIRSVAFAPEGNRMASVGNDGRLVVWSIALTEAGPKLKPIQTMDRTPSLARVAFSPDGSSIVAAGFSNTIYVMGCRESNFAGSNDGGLGRRGGNRRIVCEHADLRAMDFSPDGRLAVAGRGGEVHLYDESETGLATQARLYSTAYQASRPTELIAATTATAPPECHCRTNPGSINDIAFVPGGNQLVSVCDDGCVTLYDAGTDKIAKQVSINRGRLFAIAVLDSHRVAVAGSDDSIRIVDFSSGQVSQLLAGHHGSVVDLAVAGGGLYSSGYDGTIRRWKINLH